eukprot:CAMPEP_0170138768 /NCGR_PEP_ID=MMETSP0033_2-20121228/5165_1 /TAXON_ID=195969 /ORGANISM="Dolichomastix tenuilepis, Strain CCMP3274" /LENGTH=151 /DNA_ID=CAMNT_0010374811 /DNA_START=487 /DNA_END=942 /DNA_ORIENTATION=+
MLDAPRSSRFQPQPRGAAPVGRRGLQVVALRVGGVEIPNQKRVETALTYIYGIGPTTSKKILSSADVDNKRTKDLEEEEIRLIRDEVDKYKIEGELRRQVDASIKELIEIQCYRGRRHQMRLPVRGQNTRCNARTRKGKNKGPVKPGGKKR